MTSRFALCASAAALALAFSGPILTAPTTASAQFSIGFSVNIAPPVIPVFEQPPMPDYGYIWTPGYWAWSPAFGYYWVPGEWVLPPEPGLLWTPGYWAWRNGVFGFIGGYWAPTVGYYGGINYGYGYDGLGYEGAQWRGDRIFYNTTVNNFGGARIATTFTQPVRPRTTTRISFNGGPGGVAARPTPAELAAAHQRHVQPLPAQVQRVHVAAANPALRAPSVLHGGAKAAVMAMHQSAARTAAATAARMPNARPGAPNAAVNGRAEMRGNANAQMRPGEPGAAVNGRAGMRGNANARMRPGEPGAAVNGRAGIRGDANARMRPGEPGAAVNGRAETRAGAAMRGPGERMPTARPEGGRANAIERAAPQAQPRNERSAPNRAMTSGPSPYERGGGPGARSASPYERGGPASRENAAPPRSETAPRMEAAPRMESRPGGAPEGRPMGGERTPPNAGAPGREPSARPEGGGRPSSPPRGDEKNKQPPPPG